jgi:lysozyme family protein
MTLMGTGSDASFIKALTKTLGIEGPYSHDKNDPGGETYYGISRRYHPSWEGWGVVDSWRTGKLDDNEREIYLLEAVQSFYRYQFWDRFQGDKVAEVAEKIAIELFDTSVNMGVSRAVGFLQTALNMQNLYGKTYPDIEVDGKLGPSTIATLRRYLDWQPGNRASNETILLNCMNGEQYIFYKNNPRHERFRGWFARI